MLLFITIFDKEDFEITQKTLILIWIMALLFTDLP